MKYPDHVPNATEMHEEVPRGWFYPAALVNLLEARIITDSEFTLLGKINSLCHQERGCWASNQWLAEWWGKSPHWVSQTISKLARLNVLKVELNQKGKKTWRTIWATFQGDLIIKVPPCGFNHIPPVVKTTPSHDTSYHIKKSKLSASHSVDEADGVNGFFDVNEVSPFIKNACHHLENYVRKIHKFDPRIKRSKWYRQMILLLQSIDGDEKRLKTVLQKYITAPPDKFKPQAHCAESFRKKFLQIESYLQPPETKKDDGLVPYERIYISRNGVERKVIERVTPAQTKFLPRKLYL